MTLRRFIFAASLVLVLGGSTSRESHAATGTSLVASNAKTLSLADYADYSHSKFQKSDWDAYVKEGMGAFHAGDYEMAQKNLYKAFNLGCESPLLLFQLALISEFQKSWYSALEYYQMAGAGFKKAHKGHRYAKTFNENYGRALYYSGKKEDALPLLRAAARTTQSFWLLKMLGMMAFDEGDVDNAIVYLERSVSLQNAEVTRDELVTLYLILARLHLNKSERDTGQAYYSKVLQLDPNNAEAKRFMTGIQKSYEQDRMLKLMDQLKDI